MVYNNFFFRFIFGFILITLYWFISSYSNDYILILSFVIYFLILIEILLFFKENKFIAIIYILLSFLFFITYFKYYFNINEFNYFLTIIISFDIFSYLIGKLIGKNIILEKISPKKTYEGLIGGIILSNILILIIYNNNYNFIYFLFTNFIILFSFLGDIIESKLKRLNNLKNSSNLLPGHGGFFDRFDSFILSIIVLSLYNYLY